MSDVPGAGVSLIILDGAQLRKIFGHGGIVVSQHFNVVDADDPGNFQVRVSGAELQTAIATLQQQVSAFSTSAFLPNAGPATHTGNLVVTDKVTAGAFETGHGILTPHVIAGANSDLTLFNYGGQIALSVSNLNAKVMIAVGLTLGGGGIAEVSTGGVRALTLTHDVGTNLVCGQTTVMSLNASTGAYVQGNLHATGNCTIIGQLVVNGVNVLSQLSALSQASTGPVAVADVTGLEAALSGKQANLSSSSTLQLSELTCSLLRPAAGQQLRLANAAGVEQLGLSDASALFLRQVIAPSLDCSGSILCGGSAVISGPLYVNGQDVILSLANATIGAASQLSLTSVTASGDIQARDLIATRELQCDGAAVLNSSLSVGGALTVTGTGNIATVLSGLSSGKQATITSSTALSAGSLTTASASNMNGLRITGGQGYQGTGANLQVCGTGDSMYNTSGLFWGTSSVNTMVWELSHLGFNHFYRTSGTGAWTQTMAISLSSGGWTWYRSFGAASDRSLKGDAQDVSTEDSLAMLRQVSPKTYRRLDLEEDAGMRIGFVAQDVEAACPSLWSNLVGRSEYKWSGNDGGGIRTLDYARLVCPLWQSCRAMLARIEMLEERVAQLSASQ